MDLLEEWRPLPSDPVYQVSSLGRVRSMRGFLLKQRRFHGDVYPTVLIRNRHASVHRLVAETFLGERTGPVIRHLDGDPTNNRVENLRYGTQRENIADAIAHGTHHSVTLAAKTHCAHGHEFTPDNIKMQSGWRSCRTCHRARQTALTARRRTAK